jgi:predicted transcriptional regulator
MSKRRTAYDIIADILVIARARVKKTHIVYKANLNFEVVRKYLRRAISEGFLSYDEPYYITTELGEEFIARYTHMRSLAV